MIRPHKDSIFFLGAAFTLPAALFLSLYTSLSASTLVDNSPFVPDGFGKQQTRNVRPTTPENAATRELEFRGVYSLGGDLQFNIFDKKQQRGYWVGLNEPGANYRVTSFNEAANSIELNLGGELEELSLKSPDGKPLAIQAGNPAAPKATPAARGNVRQGQSGGNRRPVVRRRVVVPNRTRNADQANARQNTSGGAVQRSRQSGAQSTVQQERMRQARADAEKLLNQISNTNIPAPPTTVPPPPPTQAPTPPPNQQE